MPDQDNEPSENERSAIDALHAGIRAARKEIQKTHEECGAVIVLTLPPDFNTVRYSSNIPDEGVVSLLQTTAQKVAGRLNTNGQDDNIIEP